jgi:hypothetical protein
MARKPTGRPRGRPAGSGQLDNPKRITVWLKGETFDKLESYADGRHYQRGAPQLASCVRELLEHALACPYKYQTKNIPSQEVGYTRQTEKATLVPTRHSEQIETVPLVTENISRQIENRPVPDENNSGQRENVPPYDTTRYRLRPLCRGKHEWGNTGQSLVRTTKGDCGACAAEQKRNRRQATRQAQAL